jgi:LisH
MSGQNSVGDCNYVCDDLFVYLLLFISCPRSPAPSPRRSYPPARCIPWLDIVLAGEFLVLLYPPVSFTSDFVARNTHASTHFSVPHPIMAAVAPPGPAQAPPPQNEIPGALNTISWEGDKMYVLNPYSVHIYLTLTRFNIYIYDYCSKRGFRKTARELLQEAEIAPDATPPIDARQGLLFESVFPYLRPLFPFSDTCCYWHRWWSVFWVLFQAKSGGGSEDALVYTQVCRIIQRHSLLSRVIGVPFPPLTASSTETGISTTTASRRAIFRIGTPWFSVHPTSVTTTAAAGPADATANGKIRKRDYSTRIDLFDKWTGTQRYYDGHAWTSSAPTWGIFCGASSNQSTAAEWRAWRSTTTRTWRSQPREPTYAI